MGTVEDIMSSPVVTVKESETVLEVCKRFKKYKIGSVIAVKERLATGILTERDVIERVICSGRDPTTTTVEEVASHPLVTIDPVSSMAWAAEMMIKGKIKKLGVVKSGKLVGIVTAWDIVRAEPQMYEEFLRLWIPHIRTD